MKTFIVVHHNGKINKVLANNRKEIFENDYSAVIVYSLSCAKKLYKTLENVIFYTKGRKLNV